MDVDLYIEPVSRSELWKLAFKCPFVNFWGKTTSDISLLRGFDWNSSSSSSGSVAKMVVNKLVSWVTWTDADLERRFITP